MSKKEDIKILGMPVSWSKFHASKIARSIVNRWDVCLGAPRYPNRNRQLLAMPPEGGFCDVGCARGSGKTALDRLEALVFDFAITKINIPLTRSFHSPSWSTS
jgi:hypothetical protein